jgi:hypothetical protein
MMTVRSSLCDSQQMMRSGMKVICLWLFAAMTSACLPEEEVPTFVHAQQEQASAESGAWAPDDSLLDEAGGYDFAFDNAPNYDGGSGCTDGPTAGALQLRDALRDYFPQVGDVGIYNCRVIAGTNSMSLHGVGRALDIMFPTDGDDADNGLGDEVAHWLIERAPELGLQTVIWDHSIWRISRDPQFGAYTGENPHVDHIHAEINLEGGRQELPWYADPSGPIPCDAFSVDSEVIIDTDDACFAAFGPASGWRTETGVGVGGSLLWTNAFDGVEAVNAARWALPMTSPVVVQIDVAIDDTFGVFGATEYGIHDGNTETVVVIDQSAASGWTSLGNYTLMNNGLAAVTVVDNHDGLVAAQSHIVVDALRLLPVPPSSGEGEGEQSEGEGEGQPSEGEGETSEGEGEAGQDDNDNDPGPVDDDDPGTVEDPLIIVTKQTASGCRQSTVGPLWCLLFVLLPMRGRRRS